MFAGSSEVDVRQLIPVEALMSTNVWGVEDGEGKATKVAHVYFFGGKPGGGVDGVVIRALDVREL